MQSQANSAANGYEQDRLLLGRYVDGNSQTAFAMLIQRHLSMVYGACLREIGDAELAQDAAISVFLLLSRKAAGLRRGTALASWLFRTARFVSRDALKQERRRMLREQKAVEEQLRLQAQQEADSALWSQIQPYLNPCLERLKAIEREAVLLRCMEGLSLREVGEALGLSEDAARMRVNRGLEKLRQHFARLGVTLSIAALSALLADHTAHAAANLPPLLQSWTAHGAASHPAHLSPRSVRLLKGVQRTMQIARIRTAAFITLSAAVIIGGVTLVRTGASPLRLFSGAASGIRAAQGAAPADNGVAPAFLSKATLPDNFTLTFHVTDRDVRTPQQIAEQEAALKASYDTMVKTGEMTRQTADEQAQMAVEGLRSAPKEKQFDLTFAGRDGKLLLEIARPTPDWSTIPEAYLYDGQNSMALYHHDGGNEAHITPGPHLSHVGGEMPLPGVGIQMAPLLKVAPGTPEPDFSSKKADPVWKVEGAVPGLSYVNGDYKTLTPLYFPGRLELRNQGGKIQITRMVLQMGPSKQQVEQWDFDTPREFQGLSLATHTRRTITSLMSKGKPERIIEFTLQSASEQPPAEERFQLERRLTNGMLMEVTLQKVTKGFTFDAAKGGWQEQYQLTKAR